MAQELSRKSEEIRKYHAEQTVFFQRIRELIGQPAEAVTKARLYDHIIESGDPIDARMTIPILVKYSWLMNGLFEDVHKAASARRNSQTGILPDSIQIPIRNLVRGSWRGGCCAPSLDSRGAGNGFQTRKHRENARESLFVAA